MYRNDRRENIFKDSETWRFGDRLPLSLRLAEFLLGKSSSDETPETYELRLHLRSNGELFRKNASRNAFRFNYFAVYPHLSLRARGAYVSFVCRCSRSDRRAPKHVLRVYEARPIQSMHYLSPEQRNGSRLCMDEQEAEPIKIAAFLLSAALKSAPADVTKRISSPFPSFYLPYHPPVDVPWFFSFNIPTDEICLVPDDLQAFSFASKHTRAISLTSKAI
ncbi:hypothetical protein K0M31_020305 [Melipona bicolor]|uniref:Uncharacterized protein n=1 Tax=Melipona bicolor TaxID=60889 RepID=A0AA40KQU6_9HYME|nr:hypothetical protein K0M31_020305 [Melipona bicolor]